MDLRRIATVSALIYGMYGLFNLIYLGVFIPPFPLKPLLILTFLLFLILHEYKLKIHSEAVVFSMFLLVYTFSNQYLVEMFMVDSMLVYFVDKILIFTWGTSMLLFVIFVYLFSSVLFKKIKIALVLVTLTFVIFIPALFTEDIVYLDLGIAVIALLLFLLSRLIKQSSSPGFNETFQPILNAIALINIMEHFALLVGS